MSSLRRYAAVFCFSYVFLLCVCAQAGIPLDVSFAKKGRLVSAFGFDRFVPITSAIQRDGKIVVAGIGVPKNSTKVEVCSIGLIRLFSDGNLDLAFGNSGVVETVMDSSNGTCSEVVSMLLGKDESIVVLSKTELHFRTPYRVNLNLVKYRADGSLDKNFGKDGITTISDTVLGEPSDFVQQNDSTFIVTGIKCRVRYGECHIEVGRFSQTGEFDSTFGTAGTIALEGSIGMKAPIRLQPDGKMVIGNLYLIEGTKTSVPVLYRLNPDGALDTSFNSTGFLLILLGEPDRFIDFDLAKDGSLWLLASAGHLDYLGHFLSDGKPDLNFNQIGYVKPNLQQNSRLIHSGKNGGAIVAGDRIYKSVPTKSGGKIYQYGFTLARFESSGSLVADSVTQTEFENWSAPLYSWVFQDDGKFLMFGSAWSVNEAVDEQPAAFCRYLP